MGPVLAAAVVMLAGACVPPGGGVPPILACGDQHEPNDSAAQATPAPLPGVLEGVLCNVAGHSDVDWFSIPASPTQVDIDLSCDTRRSGSTYGFRTGMTCSSATALPPARITTRTWCTTSRGRTSSKPRTLMTLSIGHSTTQSPEPTALAM